MPRKAIVASRLPTGGALLGEGAVEQLALGRGVLGGDEHGAAPLAAHGDALDHAQQDQQDQGGGADLVVAGEQSHAEGGGAHHRERW